MKVGRIVCLFFILISQFVYSQTDWTWQYPYPQGNSLNDIHIFNNDTILMIGDKGTVIKTLDGGEFWSTYLQVGGIEETLNDVFFIDRNNGWIAAGNYNDYGVLLKTIDGGQNWTVVLVDSQYAFGAVHFKNMNTGLVFGEDGIVKKTIDGGKTWQTQEIDYYVHELRSIEFLNDSVGFVVGYGFYGNTIFKTTNYGDTWTQKTINPTVYDLFKVQFVDSNHGFIVGGDTFLKTSDGGNTWTYKSLYPDCESLNSVHFIDPLRGWVVGEGLYGSTDGGETWELDDEQHPCMLQDIEFAGSDEGWCVGGNGIIKRTSDRGENWITLTPGAQDYLHSIFFNTSLTGWAGGYNYIEDKSMLLKTSDQGNHWEKCDFNTGTSIYDISFANQNLGFMVVRTDSLKDRLFYTENSGLTWESKNIELGNLCSFYFINSETGWAVGYDGCILKTVDGGKTWEDISLQGRSTLFKVFFMNENVGWILPYRSYYLYKSVNGGENWTKIIVDSSASAKLRSFYFVGKTGWAVGEQNIESRKLFKTMDAGDTWNTIAFHDYCNLYDVCFKNINAGWIAAYDHLKRTSYIFYTEDGGINWEKQYFPSTRTISSLYLIDNTLWATGYGLFKLDVTDVNVDYNYKESNRENPFTLLQNYPNPFNSFTQIRFDIEKNAYVDLSVYNLLSQKVESLYNQKLNVGSYSTCWNASKYPSGIYYYVLKVDNQIQLKKMILIK